MYVICTRILCLNAIFGHVCACKSVFIYEGGGVAELSKPLASKQEWNCKAWVRILLMPRFHMPFNTDTS